MPYRRSEEEWVQLLEAGKKFLVKRATMQRTTSYTEFNAALVNRAETPLREELGRDGHR